MVRDGDSCGDRTPQSKAELTLHRGTTPLRQAFTPDRLIEAMQTGPDVYCCFVAEDADGRLVGLQALTRSNDRPNGVSDIGTFARWAHAKRDGVSPVRSDTQGGRGQRSPGNRRDHPRRQYRWSRIQRPARLGRYRGPSCRDARRRHACRSDRQALCPAAWRPGHWRIACGDALVAAARIVVAVAAFGDGRLGMARSEGRVASAR